MAKGSGNYTRLKNIRIAGGHYKKKFRWVNYCIYCGQPKECLDHVFPLSLASGLDLSRPSVKKELFQGLNMVPSCNSCNNLAIDKPFNKIKEKRRYIQKRIEKRYLKKLRTVIWSEEELKEVGPRLRADIKKMIANRIVLENRVLFPASSKTQRIY